MKKERQPSLLEKYENNPIIRSLIQLIPFGFGSALDVQLEMTIKEIRKERMAAFFDELAAGNIVVDENLLKSEDFLHCYFSTVKYALNTRRREKIRMFARLLKSSLNEDELHDTDEYEEFLNILDEFNFREIRALAILDSYSLRPRDKEVNDLQWVFSIWDDFSNQLSRELSIPENEVSNFMNRIIRTGCYEIFTGTFLDYEGGKGKLTPIYHRLKKFITDNESGN